MDENGQPEIQCGKPLRKQTLQRALNHLAGAKKKGSALEWAHPYHLVSAPGIECWWSPAQERWMHFNTAGGGLQASKPAAQPALVWIRRFDQLYVFALGENVRPGPQTPIKRSPYMNVYADGNVCLGSMPSIAKLSFEKVEEAFFSSVFTHPNYREKRLVRTMKNNDEFWRERLEAGPKKAFPAAKLHDLGMTLEALVQSLIAKEKY